MDPSPHPRRIVVMGAGIAGLMSAFYILTRMPQTQLTVVEKGKYVPNPYGTSSRSAACTRQQFDCRLNVEMSMFSTRFYERFGEHTGEQMRMLWQVGYLFLYRNPEAWASAQRCVQDQQLWGLREVRALSPDETLQEFPFVEDHGLVGSTFCPTDGFLDPGTILTALKAKLQDLGATIRTEAEVTSFDGNGQYLKAVRLADSTLLPCDFLVNCTGPWSSRVGKLLGTPLLVAPEKRYLYSAEFANPADDFSEEQFRKVPMIVCMGNGMTPYIKPEPGRNPHSFTVGCEHKTEPQWGFRDTDQDYVEPGYEANCPDGYHEKVWRELVTWVPFAENFGFRSKVNGGFYETTPPHSPVIGFDPNHSNVIHCAGFSGHGIMQGPAAGQTVADLVESGEYRTFPLGAQNLTYESLINGTRETEGKKI